MNSAIWMSSGRWRRVHVADRLAELVGENDEHQRRRDELGDRARGGDDAGRVPHA